MERSDSLVSEILVVLTKTSIKKGFKTNVKVGKKQKIKLSQIILVGYPIMKERDSDLSDRMKTAPATSTVLGIEKISDDKFEIETETSFYNLEIIKPE